MKASRRKSFKMRLDLCGSGLPYETLQDYICIPAGIPSKLVMSLGPSSLPENWRDDPPPAELRKIGDQWLLDQKSPVLKIPSAVIPVESNYLLNPLELTAC